jgi:hypothetical protein
MSTWNGIHGCGPWTWWVLGAEARLDDDWLFAGVMQDGDVAQAGIFSMGEILELERWRTPIRKQDDRLLPEGLMPVWRNIDPTKPARLMEFTTSEIKASQDEFLLKCFTRPLDFEPYPDASETE